MSDENIPASTENTRAPSRVIGRDGRKMGGFGRQMGRDSRLVGGGAQGPTNGRVVIGAIILILGGVLVLAVKFLL